MSRRGKSGGSENRRLLIGLVLGFSLGAVVGYLSGDMVVWACMGLAIGASLAVVSSSKG